MRGSRTILLSGSLCIFVCLFSPFHSTSVNTHHHQQQQFHCFCIRSIICCFSSNARSDASFRSLVLRRYSSRPPAFLMHLSACVVSFTRTLWPSTLDSRRLFWTFGSHRRRLLFPLSLTLLPDRMILPPQSCLSERRGTVGARDRSISRADSASGLLGARPAPCPAPDEPETEEMRRIVGIGYARMSRRLV